MSEKTHVTEELQEFVDGRLTAGRMAEVKTHLDACPGCQGEYEAMAWVKALAAASHVGIESPPGLERSIQDLLDREDRRRAGWPASRRRRLALTVAASLLGGALAFTWWLGRTAGDLPTAVSRDYRDIRSGELQLSVVAASTSEVESFFRREGIRFRTRVFDLAMMNYRVKGGHVHRLAGRPSALFVYEGESGKIVACQMYAGRVAELPPPTEVRSHRGFDFYIYQRGALTLVFWQEGEVVCVLAGDFDSGEIVGLAFEKAML